LSTRTHGSSCRRRASSSLRRVSSFSAPSSWSRAASHSSRVPVLMFDHLLAHLFFSPLGRCVGSCHQEDKDEVANGESDKCGGIGWILGRRSHTAEYVKNRLEPRRSLSRSRFTVRRRGQQAYLGVT